MRDGTLEELSASNLFDRAFVAVFSLVTVAYLVHILNVLVLSGAIPKSASTGLALPLSGLVLLTFVWAFKRIVTKTAVWARFVAWAEGAES